MAQKTTMKAFNHNSFTLFLLPAALFALMLPTWAAATDTQQSSYWGKRLGGSRWQVQILFDRDGAANLVPDGIAIDLRFDPAAARVSGLAGCNRYSANVKFEGQQVAFGSVATSKRRCPEPDGLMDWEQRFLIALSRVEAAHVNGELLTLATSSSHPVLLLVALGEQ